MNNLESLAAEIGKDIKGIKEQQVTKNELEQKAYLTSHQSLSGYALKSELYNDIPIKARISALENRPSFDTLTPTQRNSLKGENGHSLSVNVRIEGSYRNGATSQLNLFADVFYDGEKLTSGYTLDYYYRGFGNNNWGVLRNQTPDSAGKFGTWSATQRSGGWFEVRIEVSYRGLKASGFAHLDNVNDGERGATGARGADGEPGQNIVNQQGQQALKYWAGTQAQYDALPTKDPNTIYDIFKQV